jgi:hypothetical protein
MGRVGVWGFPGVPARMLDTVRCGKAVWPVLDDMAMYGDIMIVQVLTYCLIIRNI